MKRTDVVTLHGLLDELLNQTTDAATREHIGAVRQRVFAQLNESGAATGGTILHPDPRPAFVAVLRAIADWRHEALADPAQHGRRDRKLTDVDQLFKEMFGPLGDKYPR